MTDREQPSREAADRGISEPDNAPEKPTPKQNEPRRTLSADQIAFTMAAIEGSAALAGHTRDPESLDRARRILEGRITLDQALDEITAKYTSNVVGDKSDVVPPEPGNENQPFE